MALGALALDVAIGQEHALDRVEELLDAARFNQPRRPQLAIDVLGKLDVLWRIGRMPVVERNAKAPEVLGALGGDPGDELLWRDSFGLSLEHDGRAVRVVGAHEMDRMPRHAQGPHPDVGLDVLHDVADMEGAVCVGKRSGDENGAGHVRRRAKDQARHFRSARGFPRPGHALREPARLSGELRPAKPGPSSVLPARPPRWSAGSRSDWRQA